MRKTVAKDRIRMRTSQPCLPIYPLLVLALLLVACASATPATDVATPVVVLPSPTESATPLPVTVTPTNAPTENPTATAVVQSTVTPAIAATSPAQPPVMDTPTIDLTLTPAGDYLMGGDTFEITGTIEYEMQQIQYGDLLTYMFPFTETASAFGNGQFVQVLIFTDTEIIDINGERASRDALQIGKKIRVSGGIGGGIDLKARTIWILE